MKPKLLVAGWLLFLATAAVAQPDSYRIFDSNGKQTTFKKLIKEANKSDVVFFGELHNNTLGHWLELQIFKSLEDSSKKWVFGTEMLEADDQLVIDEYLAGLVDEKNFLKVANLPDNYTLDYHPLVIEAKSRGTSVMATNIPRRYANLVFKKGLSYLDTLAPLAKTWIAPLPITVDKSLPGYKELVEGMPQHGPGSGGFMVEAQAVKDATMAYFIGRTLDANQRMYHVNGSYHTQNHAGIIWYLTQLHSNAHVLTIQLVEQDAIDELRSEHFGKADIVICVPSDMTKSY